MTKINVTGSMTVSKIAMEFFPSGVSGGRILLDINADAVTGTEKRATNNVLSLTSLCYALVKSGVVGKANLANILALAAETKDMDSDTAAAVEQAIAETKAAIEARLPMVPVAPSLRIKGSAVAA